MNIYGNAVGHPLPDPRKGMEMSGPINMNGQAIKGLNAPTADDEAVNWGVAKKAIYRNLLDNSDFTNPVNQRGQTSYVVTGAYTIDRWMSSGTVEVVEGGIRVSSGVFRQRIENLDVNKTYTLAAEDSLGNVHVVTGVPQNGAFTDGADFEICVSVGVSNVVVGLKSGLTYKWAALYEGEHTAETLPEYQPKGYGAELAECQWYLRPIVKGESDIGVRLKRLDLTTWGFDTQYNMRIAPSLLAVGNPRAVCVNTSGATGVLDNKTVSNDGSSANNQLFVSRDHSTDLLSVEIDFFGQGHTCGLFWSAEL